jgi:hypothetical protein
MENPFSPESGVGSPNTTRSLIPAGTLAFAVVLVQEIKKSGKTGGEYARLEFAISEGEFTGRRIWSIVMNPLDKLNINEENRAAGKSDGAKMGLVSITRMFEAAGIVDPSNKSSYQVLNGKSFPEILDMMSGNTVAIKVKIAPGKDGYEDKNEIADYLTPNPQSTGHSGWLKLTSDLPNKASPKTLTQPAKVQVESPLAIKPKWIKNPGNNPY